LSQNGSGNFRKNFLKRRENILFKIRQDGIASKLKENLQDENKMQESPT
jgi:hypothetical protein